MSEKASTDGGGEHLQPISDCVAGSDVVSGYSGDVALLTELGEVLFPYPLGKYPGRRKAMGFALCMPVSVVKLYSGLGGNARMSLPVLLRAEKLARDTALRLMTLADQFKAEAGKRPKPNKRRGMFDIRVRDETGIPRSGLWRDYWRKNKAPF